MSDNSNTPNSRTLWTMGYTIISPYVTRYGGIEAFLADAIDYDENKIYTTRMYSVADFAVDHRSTSKIHHLIAQREWKEWLDKCTAAQEQ